MGNNVIMSVVLAAAAGCNVYALMPDNFEPQVQEVGKAVAALQADAAGVCYKLSKDGIMFSRTEELLCVKNRSASPSIILGFNGNGKFVQVAQFDMPLVSRAQNPSRNEDQYKMLNPQGTLFDRFAIRFKGEIKADGSETGTVEIGAVMFHYKKSAR